MNARRRREETALERRRLIVDVAMQCFAENGFHRTSLRDLARRAGISLGNVYNHFESKNDLIREIADLEAEELRALQIELDRIANPQKALDQFIQHYVRYCAEPENAGLAAEILSEGLRNPEIRSGFRRNRAALADALADLVARLWERAGKSPDLRAIDGAQAVLDLVEGYALRAAFEDRSPSRRDLATLKAGAHRLLGL